MTRIHALAAGALAGALLAASAWAQDEPLAGPAPPLHRNPIAAPVIKEMAPPKIATVTVDWDGVRAVLSQLSGASSSEPKSDSDALARLNAAADATYREIAKSTVPVLLPVDTATVLRTKAAALPPPEGDIAGFKPHFFLAGPAGYDAAFTLAGAAADEVKGFARKEDPLILISGFAITYEINAPVAEAARPVKELEPLYPGIRRRFLENYVRYSFEKFGTPYVVSMLCHDGRTHVRWVTCREADAVVTRFLKVLQIAGGTPQQLASSAPNTVDRPKEQSPDFTFAAPGRLIENTGFRHFDGHPDWTVYARIRFPLDAPAYANSQAFLNWGNCDFTGTTLRRQKKDAPYRCKVNDKPLVFNESSTENRAYPWRDNFCEHRRYYVGQCPGGEGHQGQDIRPSTCKLLNDGADRCQPFHDNVVAVRDGTIMRQPQRESLYLFVNAPGEHLRFRYLHMHPGQLDASELLSGRTVKEGDVLGKVGNFDRIPNGTSYHLHFEVQVPTREGWVFVSPYATLIASYERLIGGRGSEFVEPEPAPKPEVPADKVAEKPAKPAKTAHHVRAKRAAPAKTAAGPKRPPPRHAAKQNVRPSATAAPTTANVIGGGLFNSFTGNADKGDAAKKEAKGDKKAERKGRRAATGCKTPSAEGGSERACSPHAAKRRASANGV
jgi:hypothetical protein